MKTLHLAVAVLLVAGQLRAQATASIRGHVTDQNGVSVPGTQIELDPVARRVVAGETGSFSLANVSVGEYLLTARRIGYRPSSIHISVADSTDRDISIRLVAISRELDSVRIIAKSQGLRYSAIVLDQDNAPVKHAEVHAAGVSSNLETDSLGRFAVPHLYPGTLVLRIRKLGYVAYFGALRIVAARADTLRMPRLAATLSAVEVDDRSGFGKDVWYYRDMEQRMRWRGNGEGAISREELDELGNMNLCDALPRTATGALMNIGSDRTCNTLTTRVLIDGWRCIEIPLAMYNAADIELVEYFRIDRALSLAGRNCRGARYVLWLRTSEPRSPRP